MKKLVYFLLAIFIIVGVSSCYTHGHGRGHMPPGKAKKVHGDKSAKRHAPGQRKKKPKILRHDVYYYAPKTPLQR